MMKRMGGWMLLALLTLVGEWHGRCYGCLEEERIGLLEIKALIDPDGFFLRDWVDSSNCCEWPRIECDNTTYKASDPTLSFLCKGFPLGRLCSFETKQKLHDRILLSKIVFF